MSTARKKIGHKAAVAPDKRIRCRACNGTGWSPHRDFQECDQCDGTGKVFDRRKLP